MKTLKQWSATATLVFISTFISHAHEGHGHESPLSPGHYIANPEHALPIALTLAAVLVGGWLIYRTTSRARGK